MTRSGGTMWPMSASLLEYAPAVTGVVLLAVLLAGVLAGRSKSRWTALAGGIVLIFAAGVVLTAVGGGPENDDPAAELTALYTITLPLLIAFVAGWLLVRGGWLRRFLVIAIGAFLLVAFPYAAAGQATATAFLPGG
jgi:CHASE2 domain-containing sensor protein